MSKTGSVARNRFVEMVTATGRIPGGDASRAWLEQHGYIDRDGMPSASPAWNKLCTLPGFAWQMGVGQTGRPCVRVTNYPRIVDPDGVLRCPSMADLIRHVTGQHLLNFAPPVERGYAHLLPILGVPRLGMSTYELVRAPAFRPPATARAVQALSRWLQLAAKGETVSVVTFVCPDWAVDANDRYTFDGLGTGVGLVARRALLGIQQVNAWALGNGVDVRYVVAIGDFEADSPAACQRVGIDPVEFRRRCAQSQAAFRAQLENNIPKIATRLTTVFATELAGGHDAWSGHLQAAHKLIQKQGVAEALKLRPEDVRDIIAARRSLYQRWYGADVDAQAVLAAQLPEYAAMGVVAQGCTPNALVLGADAHVMAPAFNVMNPQEVPVIYLRNNDY